jgi:dipeptide transport system permease protein
MSSDPIVTATLTDADLASLTASGTPAEQPTPLREFWRHFSANAGAVAGLAIVIAVLLIAVFAGVLAPHSPVAIDNTAYLKPPAWIEGGSWTYPLGTDAIGRDILSRLMHGARLSLSIGVAVVTLSIIVGTCLGMAAAFFRGVTEIAIMRLMDVLLSLPSLLLAIVIVAILGPGLMNAMLAVAVVVLPHYVRTARAAAMTELSRDYVTAKSCPTASRRSLSRRRWGYRRRSSTRRRWVSSASVRNHRRRNGERCWPTRGSSCCGRGGS